MRGYSVPPWPPGYGWRRGPEAVPAADLRVSDAERRELADALSSHFAEGRLDQAEFDDRLSEAMAAKTRGDLAGLLRDLPPLPHREPDRQVGRVRRRSRAALVLVGAVLFLFATTSWAWNSWAWRGWFWRPHLPFLLTVVVAVLMIRRAGWRWHHLHGWDGRAGRR